jgi:hypothetical protein
LKYLKNKGPGKEQRLSGKTQDKMEGQIEISELKSISTSIRSLHRINMKWKQK